MSRSKHKLKKGLANKKHRSSSFTYVLIFNQDNKARSFLIYDLFDILSRNGIQIDYAIFCTNNICNDGMNESIRTELQNGLQTEYARIWRELSRSRITIVGTIEEALENVRLLNKETHVFITGSLHLVGGALTILEN